MKFEELRKDNIIFSYQTGPTYGAEGADGGFSVTLYGNGNLRYCTYKLMDQISSMQIFKLSKGQTKMVYDVVAPFADELKKIPAELDNGSVGGEFQDFVFLDWTIKTCNIQKRHSQMFRQHKLSYYKKYKENIKYEDMILKVFQKICKRFKKQEILLTLHECKMREDFRLKVTW